MATDSEQFERLDFERVSFAYQSGNEVISDVSFRLEPGRSVAVVGTSGSGKSAIPRLLLGMLAPSTGAIRVDGQLASSIDVKLLREAICYLPQEPQLSDGTIFDNIIVGRPGANMGEVIAAAQAADAHAFIGALPGGYNSAVGRRGCLLSNGQRQRIALARAFLRDSRILVVDEPIADDGIVSILRRLMLGRATLIISRHLELAEHADEVLVMHNGRVVESGPHQWLVNQGVVYQQLRNRRSGRTNAISPISWPRPIPTNLSQELISR